ncbi:MAG: hypothetical protein SOR40_00125 [Rothia sp. (in: high G+C Gram-positive bacteria)]|nr:hypothetical protein [Rothia sp. (in: high G+C Gram-positive bacteria)]
MFSPELLDLFNLWVEGLSNSPIGKLQDFDFMYSSESINIAGEELNSRKYYTWALTCEKGTVVTPPPTTYCGPIGTRAGVCGC